MSTGSSRPVRPWLFVALGAVVLVAIGVGVTAIVQSARRTRAAHHAEVVTDRENREKARIQPLPAPVPKALPLLGTPGTDPDGYPLQYVDRAGMRALLAARDFKELTSYFEQLQSAFEADPRKEYWPDDAADSFDSSEPEILASLDAWVATTPGSFAPYLARGSHWIAVTWARRGWGYRSETPDEDMRAMRAASGRALEDLDRALALRPGLVSAMRLEMSAALPISDHARAERMRALAFAACPGCLYVRAVYLNSLIPRWGGSYDAIKAYVDTLSPRDNPRFRALGGYVDFDLANVALLPNDPKRFENALADVDRALAHGDYWGYLYLRARALRGLRRVDEALTTINRADALRPMNPAVLSERAALHANRNEWMAAGRDLLTALRIEPTEPDGKRYAFDVMNGLLNLARASDSAGKRQDALDAVQLVLDLSPDDEVARAVRAKIGGD